MSAVKILSYLMLIGLAVGFGFGFYSARKHAEAAANPTNEVVVVPSRPAPPAAPAPTNAPPQTNTQVSATNPIASTTNQIAAGTNAIVPPTNVAVQTTNALSNPTNAIALAATNAVTNLTVQATNISTASTNKPPPAAVAPSSPEPVVTAAGQSSGAKKGFGKMIAFFGGFVFVAIAFGLMAAHDISQYFGNQTVGFLFNDEGEGVGSPEYEEAEAVWANGEHLEAIRMMRAYYEEHPREIYVAMRIAEIYEKDLLNDLAAALEYEQILNFKFDRQRWGWAAIHLCNLYSKLGKTEKAIELLYRIHNEYGDTPAAEKARKRLAQIDPNFSPIVEAIEAADQAAAQEETEPAKPESNLPPGFRPKKH
jgi:hypothetical protein